MEPDTVATFFALVLVAGIGAVAVAVATGRAVRAALAPFGLAIAALVASASTAGSLYFSEVADFEPCEMCWYQRIAMYPLAAILTLAAIRREVGVATYVLPIAGVGAALSAYHVQLQLFPEQGSSCSLSAPCTAKWVEALGFATIPVMALMSFALVIALTTLAYRSSPVADRERFPR